MVCSKLLGYFKHGAYFPDNPLNSSKIKKKLVQFYLSLAQNTILSRQVVYFTYRRHSNGRFPSDHQILNESVVDPEGVFRSE